MTKDTNKLKTQRVACGWQLVTHENTIVMDNDQGNIAILATSNFRGAPAIMLKVSDTGASIESSSYFEQSISITLDKKIIIKCRPDIEDN